MQTRRFSNVIGFDDAPFAREHRGDVLLVGAVYANTRLEGVLSAKVRRDGANATQVVTNMVAQSRFAAHTQLIMLQGIAFAGFNVVDLHGLYDHLKVPILVVARKAPDMRAIRKALLEQVSGGKRKWALIEKAGPMKPIADVYIQTVGISLQEAGKVIKRFAINSILPEPLRTAHIIAAGVTLGESRHRP
jgi:endonuclease V-like protein UPF0215 family